MVILIFRPQTLLSGTRHAPDTIKYDSGPRMPSGRVYSHLRGLYSRIFIGVGRPGWAVTAKMNVNHSFFSDSESLALRAFCRGLE